jgi:multisubunit Na+/H+ antiporter MnhG subunit
VLAWVLLAAGGLLELLAILGVILLRDALDRLHYVSAAVVAAVLIPLAILVRESFSQIGVLGLALAGFVVFTGPVLSHVTARAIDHARRGPP